METSLTFNSVRILDLLIAGAGYLEQKGVDFPRVEADLLLSHVLGVSRVDLYLMREEDISGEKLRQYAELLVKRGDREPLAYLLKTREFMGLDFYVDQRVLIPRPETELLVEKILEIGKTRYLGEQVRILDLGTGSGAIAVSLAYYWPEASLTAVDISGKALAVAEENARRHKVKLDLRQGNLFRPVSGEKFTIIASNPPYVSQEEYTFCSPEVKKEPTLALLGGWDGLEFYREIALRAGEYLLPGGFIILEIGQAQGPKVAELFRDKGFETSIYPDYAGLDRIVLAEKK
ncbi:MAG TPA: peptide chain release factor N(5)-glutamine methyltransferase [Peptococcaceae bacterium]|nr:peptide chain release factor N(5)-glutamine methyltransferase [Peptococcaceae bacterium]